MYQGKSKKKGNKVMWLYALSIALLLLSVCTTGVFAYLKLIAGTTDNRFNSAQSFNPIINEETFYGNIKENVTVNVGEIGYSVYVRAAVVVTWQDSSGNVYVMPPQAGEDYSIIYGKQWKKSDDDYWYYDSVVKSGEVTDCLITECKPLKKAPVEGYTLNVKVVAQTIQSAGFTDVGNVAAKTDVWNQSQLCTFFHWLYVDIKMAVVCVLAAELLFYTEFLDQFIKYLMDRLS